MCVIITHRCKWNQCLSEELWDLEFGRQSVFRRGRPLVVTEGDCGTGSRDTVFVHSYTKLEGALALKMKFLIWSKAPAIAV